MLFPLFYAKFLGLYCIITAFAMLFNYRHMKQLIADVCNNSTLIILSGCFTLIFGLVILLTHSIWTGWPILISLIGCLSVIRGIVDIYFTDWSGMMIRYFLKDSYYFTLAVSTLVLGFILLVCGFVIK